MLVHVGDGACVFEDLQRRGVIVRPVGGYGLPDHLRVTVGLPPENVEVVGYLDDSPTIRRMVRSSLVTAFPSATFVEAGSGLEAIEQLTLGPVTLMVLDLNMPDMHGRRSPSAPADCWRRTPVSNPERAGDEFIAGFMDDYFAECDEHLTEVRRILVAADPEDGPGLSPAAVEDLFRSFHSLKGLSGMVELREAELLAHEMESYLRLLRDHQAVYSHAGHLALVKGTQLLEQARRS